MYGMGEHFGQDVGQDVTSLGVDYWNWSQAGSSAGIQVHQDTSEDIGYIQNSYYTVSRHNTGQ